VESPLPESDRADGAREAGKQAGRLEYAEKTLNDLKKDNQKLRNRVEQLEASTASGWTELRFMKSELLEANQRLSEIREEKDQLEANLKEADVNLGASRRTAASAAAEKDRIAEWFKEEQEERRTLDERYAEIKALYRQALLGNKP
jgi:chromosome segregation ATPase